MAMRPDGRRRARGTEWVLAALLLMACGGGPPPPTPSQVRARSLPPEMPDSAGWGVQVLAIEQDSAGRVWAGTYGNGLLVLDPVARDTAAGDTGRPRPRPIDEPPEPRAERPGQGRTWRRILAGDGSISWNVVNSIGFTRAGTVWYGTVGNGFGMSADTGRTWRNWTFDELGPRWQYVAPNGVQTRGDTVYIATADGLRITRDGGERWTCVVARGSRTGDATCDEQVQGLDNEYLLSLDVDVFGRIWTGSLAGVSMSEDGGRTWRSLGAEQGLPRDRVRALLVNTDSSVWVATERALFVDSTRQRDRLAFDTASVRPPGFARLPGGVRAMVASPGRMPPTFALSYGMAAGDLETGNYRLYYLSAAETYRPTADLWSMLWWGPPLWPVGASSTGLNLTLAGDFRPDGAYSAARADAPSAPRHAWFQRPIADTLANPWIDATYRYGSTLGGAFQEHQGVEFNNPRGTPVHAAGPGVVVFAGEAEAGSNTVAILHDRQWEGRSVFTTYYHNASLDVRTGDRVAEGQVIARVGNTGRATNNHLHFEVHVAPTTDSAAIVDPEQRFPPHTVNPQLWLEPMPGTGIVAGRVLDAQGRPVQGARVHGLVLAYPVETPYAFAETYGERGHPDPAYGENFAVGDVPAGDYVLGVDIEGERVWRRVRVTAGSVTFVEFRPS